MSYRHNFLVLLFIYFSVCVGWVGKELEGGRGGGGGRSLR